MLTWLGVFGFCPRFHALKTGQFRDFAPQRAISRLQNPLSFLRTVERACECWGKLARSTAGSYFRHLNPLGQIVGPVMIPRPDFGDKSLNYDPCAGPTTRYLAQTHHTTEKSSCLGVAIVLFLSKWSVFGMLLRAIEGLSIGFLRPVLLFSAETSELIDFRRVWTIPELSRLHLE